MKINKDLNSIKRHAEEIVRLADKLIGLDNVDMKVCPLCKKDLPKGEFYWNAGQRAYASNCKSCEKSLQNKKYQNKKAFSPKTV